MGWLPGVDFRTVRIFQPRTVSPHVPCNPPIFTEEAHSVAAACARPNIFIIMSQKLPYALSLGVST